jgi:acyl dehydratase
LTRHERSISDSRVEVLRRFELTDVVAYSGATWDWHRMHYDQAHATASGLPGPVVDGQLLTAILAGLVQDLAGPTYRLSGMSFRFGGMVFVGETVRFTVRERVGEDGDGATRTFDLSAQVEGHETRAALKGASAAVVAR